jgi:tetratricopeptide (TPR) repeat protein
VAKRLLAVKIPALLVLPLVASLAFISGARALSPDEATKEIARARSLVSDGRFDDACAELRNVIEADPKNVEAHYFLGYVLGRQGKYEASIAHEKAALDVDPNNASAYSVLGLSLGSLRDYPQAAIALQRSLTIDSSAPSTYVNLAAVLEKQGNPQGACDIYKQAIALNPKYAKAYLGYGEALGKLGKHKEQVEACRQAAKYAPKSAIAHAKLGLALSASGDMAGSLAEGFAANALKVQESWSEFLGTFLAAWGLVFIGFSLIFAVVFAGSRFKPQDGETVLRSFFLTFYKDQPGRFVVTDQRLVFVPEIFSKLFGATRVSIQRAQIESIQYLSTMGSGTVSVLTRDESVHQFRMPLLVLDPLRNFLVGQALAVPVESTPPVAEVISSSLDEFPEDALKDVPAIVVYDPIKNEEGKSSSADSSSQTKDN